MHHYLVRIVSSCSSSKASATLPPNFRVSIAALNRQINDVMCFEHMHLEVVRLFHEMNTATCFSAAHVLESTRLEEAVFAFESCWIFQFWLLCSVHTNSALCKGVFTDMLELYGIRLRPVPPYRHQNHMLEPPYGPIRSIFIRLGHAEPSFPARLLAPRAAQAKNDLYYSDVVATHENAKGFT